MARPLSAKKLATEFFRRRLAFHMSGMTGYKHGYVLNTENSPRSTDVEVVELVRTGQAKMSRTKGICRKFLTADPAPAPRFRAQPKRWTVIHLTASVPSVVDVTCPGCGEPFAAKHFDGDTWYAHHHSSWHAYDCPLRVDHHLDRYPQRSNEVKQRKRGRKSLPYRW